MGWIEPPLLTDIYETLFLVPVTTFDTGGPDELALTPMVLLGPPATFTWLEDEFLRYLFAEELLVSLNC